MLLYAGVSPVLSFQLNPLSLERENWSLKSVHDYPEGCQSL